MEHDSETPKQKGNPSVCSRPDCFFQLDEERFAQKCARPDEVPRLDLWHDKRTPFAKLGSGCNLDELTQLASLVARGEIPSRFLEVFKLVWFTSFLKPGGGIRGIVVGYVFRRVLARTIAQQVSKAVEEATAPFQYALKTRAGTE